MRKNTIRKILAIDPGTRNMGYAVFAGKELCYYGIKRIPKLGSAREELKIGRSLIYGFIKDFSPQVLIVEKTFFSNSKSAVLLNKFTNEIRCIGKRKKLTVISMAANTVRKGLCGNGSAGKEDVARTLVSLYSELKSYLRADTKWKEKYYRNMFDAVALGVMCQRNGF